MNVINKRIGVLLLFTLFISFGTKAQHATSTRISKILVISEGNFVDDHSKHRGWVELFNTSAGAVNIAECYLTDDKDSPMKYPTPKGSVLTQIRPRQYTLFQADGQPGRGTFRVNFVLDPSKENYITLCDADGKTLIGEVTIPAGQMIDINCGGVIGGKDEWAQLKEVTPNTNNLTLDPNGKIDNFKQNGSLGIGMAITTMAVAFLGLFLLHIILKQIGRLFISMSGRSIQGATGTTDVSVDAGQEPSEIFAAIATTLYEMSDDNYDIEHVVLTIHKVQRTYSSWGSKLCGLCQTPHK